MENVRIWAFCGKELGLSEKYVINQTDISVSNGLPGNPIELCPVSAPVNALQTDLVTCAPEKG